MIETIMSYWKPARIVIWIILLTFFFKQVLFPIAVLNCLHLWTLIKHRKCIYIILNFIIISILILSTSFTPFFTKLYLKLHKSFCNTSNNIGSNNSSLEYQHNDNQSTNKVASPTFGDDHHNNHNAWWFTLSQMDHEPGPTSSVHEVQKTASFGVPGADKRSETTITQNIPTGRHSNNTDKVIAEDSLEEKSANRIVSSHDDDTWWFFSLDHNCEVEPSLFQVVDEENEPGSCKNTYCQIDQEHNPFSSTVGDNTVGHEGQENYEEDNLDATWKAIMESKGKESGPLLKKSDTWSAGDGRVEETNKEKGGLIRGLSKYRVTAPLKKWQSFRDMIEKREYFGGGGGDGDRGGGGGNNREWKSVDMALTFQDGLKKRADAFIARFTHDIRLERLESYQRFMEIINRGL